MNSSCARITSMEVGMEAYRPEIEQMMKRHFQSLKEHDRRRYAAVEVAKLGHGGIKYIRGLFGCDIKTIHRGIQELTAEAELDASRTRKTGGGRKKRIESESDIEPTFLKVLEDHTAGDPMRTEVKWTNLSLRNIVKRMDEMGTHVSRDLVSKLLKKHGYRRRKAQKKDHGATSSRPKRPV